MKITTMNVVQEETGVETPVIPIINTYHCKI